MQPLDSRGNLWYYLNRSKKHANEIGGRKVDEKVVSLFSDSIRVTLTKWNGEQRVDIRYTYSEGGGVRENKPSKRGVSLKLSQAREILEQALALVEEAEDGQSGN